MEEATTDYSEYELVHLTDLESLENEEANYNRTPDHTFYMQLHSRVHGNSSIINISLDKSILYFYIYPNYIPRNLNKILFNCNRFRRKYYLIHNR